jgi:hypothetical protein
VDVMKAPREFSDARRQTLADSGAAMPDGSYPIPDKDALRRAIASYGRAKDPAAVKAHIIKRARALGATSMLPEAWGGAPAKASMAAGHAAIGAGILQQMYSLLSCEADEPDQAANIQSSIRMMQAWMAQESAEIGSSGDLSDDDLVSEMKAAISGRAKGFELKAADLTSREASAWLSGERPRRVLAVPFYGPIPGPDGIGRDLEGEYFDGKSDLVGPFRGLRESRDRLVDWHHDNRAVGDPRAAQIKGATLGRMTLDPKPEDVGWWADWWTRAGEANRRLTEEMVARNTALFASSQPVKGATVVDPDGHISVWPLYRISITTSPMNRFAVVPELKGILTGDFDLEPVGLDAIRAFAVGLDALLPNISDEVLPGGLRTSHLAPAKAGRVLSAVNEAALREAVDLLSIVLGKLLKDPEIAEALIS